MIFIVFFPYKNIFRQPESRIGNLNFKFVSLRDLPQGKSWQSPRLG
ncbi:MAG: hypothetical protein J6W29_09645 [Neisseriaceae bacterium]|nr:hypothetical protein [Neisseriaceae bacterium]